MRESDTSRENNNESDQSDEEYNPTEYYKKNLIQSVGEKAKKIRLD